MTRFSSLAVLGVATLGLSLATPAISQAQSFGVRVNVGRTHVAVGNGYSYLPSVTPRYDVVYRPSYAYDPCHETVYRQVIVVPGYYVPAPGYVRPHGEVIIQHRGYYEIRRY